jgi:hypothetical protein
MQPRLLKGIFCDIEVKVIYLTGLPVRSWLTWISGLIGEVLNLFRFFYGGPSLFSLI